MIDDQTFLHQFTSQTGNDSRHALDQLIRRHLNLVYASALRQVRDPHLAEDITQAVFLILAQKARTIRDGVAVGGWLIAVTRTTAVDTMRKISAQRRHDLALAKPESIPPQPPEWHQIAPLLDAALEDLPARDRDAIVLRILENQPLAAVGAQLHLSEAAAGKRVARALAQLKNFLARRGIASTTQFLTATLTLHAIHPAPAHLLAATLTGATSTSATLIAKGVTHMLNLAKFVKAAAIAVILGTSLLSSVLIIKASAQAAGPVTVATSAAQPPATNQTSPFSPTVELVIHDGELVDLDAGKTMERPARMPGEFPLIEGIDLSYDSNSDDVGDAIGGFDIMAAQMSASNFDSDWRPINNVKSLLMVNQPGTALLSTAGGLHAYVVRTRSGNVGFLEIVSKQDAQRRAKTAVTIRYRFTLPAAREQVLAEMVSQDVFIPGWTFLGALQQDMTAAIKAAEADRLSAARTAALRVQSKVHWLDVMAKGTTFEKDIHKAARTATRLLDVEGSDGPTIKQDVEAVQKALVAPSETIRKAGSRTP